ncbi:helix-turn-helix domain-containing protein [Streptomyces sp. NPDC054796]
METPRLRIGTRLRHARERNGRTQAAIAGLCGITVEYLSQIERGLKTPSVDVLLLIAHELGVPLAYLLDGKPPPSGREGNIAAVPSVADALMSSPAARSRSLPAAPAVLRDRVEAVWRTWQTSAERFSEAAEVLPALIADTERAIRAHRRSTDTAARREVFRCAADLYGMLRSYCRRTARIDSP